VITLRAWFALAYMVTAIDAGKKTADIKNPKGETVGIHCDAPGFFRQVEKRGAFAAPLSCLP
jgi:hypothetical protein